MEEKYILLSKNFGYQQSKLNEIVEYTKKKLAEKNLTGKVAVKLRLDNYYINEQILLSILPDKLHYTKVDFKLIDEIIDDYLINGKIVERNRFQCDELLNRFFENFGDYNYFNKQLRLTLRNCGIIDPESIDDYILADGFKALAKMLTKMKPLDVIEEMRKSGLRGRGGGGYPTYIKWTNGHRAKSETGQKYIICNADEGDPGAFMDRSTIEGDPFSIIEGMAIAGYAVGADKGYVYIRAEYPLAIKRLENAIKLAKENNFLGKNILGTNFNFEIDLRLGAGAFVCGEETALIASIEGRRGTPRPRPPYPSIKGLFGCPTVINNVETLANVPVIILDGGDFFARIGTEQSKGTKVFALA
ncbi:MAG TPA: NADH-quinone oxidoreductase subunit J/K, partial [bacterium]|nr:NADH-quinone oxidoreductase subunit J/K [bacterium]